MKKQVWLGLVVVFLLAVAVMPVMAEGGQNQIRWQGNVFALVGEVTAVDATAKTITVKVYSGNQLVKGYLAQELTIVTNEGTMFLRYGETKCEVITFADVEPGDYISVNGNVLNDLFVAKRVTVDVPLHYQQ